MSRDILLMKCIYLARCKEIRLRRDEEKKEEVGRLQDAIEKISAMAGLGSKDGVFGSEYSSTEGDSTSAAPSTDDVLEANNR